MRFFRRQYRKLQLIRCRYCCLREWASGCINIIFFLYCGFQFLMQFHISNRPIYCHRIVAARCLADAPGTAGPDGLYSAEYRSDGTALLSPSPLFNPLRMPPPAVQISTLFTRFTFRIPLSAFSAVPLPFRSTVLSGLSCPERNFGPRRASCLSMRTSAVPCRSFCLLFPEERD